MRTRTGHTLAALSLGALVLAAGGPASAARAPVPVSESLPITPTTSTITVNGHGFGHGHGMSQYGAKGAALAGQSYQQILAFYYPTTVLSTLSTGIRVLVTGDTDNNTTVLPAPGLRVRDLGNGRTYRLRTKRTPRAWRLVRTHGHTKVFYRTSRWHLYRTGGRRSLAGDGELSSASGQVTLKLPTGNRPYRGALRYVNRDTVNVLSLEDYLKGVIASEMPASWPDAALQAQAVAARTYAARERADHLDRYYQICDTTACQVYRGVAAEQASSNAAAAATAGQVLTFGPTYAFTQFSSSSGGLTSAGSPSQPYLRAQADTWDTAAVDPHHDWSVPVPVDRLRTVYGTGGELQSVEITQREDPLAPDKGRVVTMVLHGTGSPATKSLSGADFRSLYGLRSTYFSLAP